MKTKVNKLNGAALDWAVAQVEDIPVVAWKTPDRDAYFVVHQDAFVNKDPLTFYGDPDDTYYPSVNWASGGEIIEREGISVIKNSSVKESWDAQVYNELGSLSSESGSTALVAAMRCYVASKLGDEIDVPDDLV